MTSRRESLRGALWSCGQALIVFSCCTALLSLQAEAVPVPSEISDMRKNDSASDQEIRFILHPENNDIGTGLDSGSAHAMTPPEVFLRNFVVPKTGGRTKRSVHGNKIPELCDGSPVDAAFNSADGSASYIFKGKYYWKVTDAKLLPGYPKLIATTWNDLPDNIDMAYTDDHGATYFYKGLIFWKYVGERISPGWPREIANIETPMQIALYEDSIKLVKDLASLAESSFCIVNIWTALMSTLTRTD